MAEKNFDRKMKGQARSLNAQYDDYLNAVEDHTFNKLHASLDRMERKAEREHQSITARIAYWPCVARPLAPSQSRSLSGAPHTPVRLLCIARARDTRSPA